MFTGGPIPAVAQVSTQVCYSASVTSGGIGVAGQMVLLMQQGVDAPLAQGETGEGGSVQLCFTTPATPTQMNLFACWDLDGSGTCDEGEPRSNVATLTVSRLLLPKRRSSVMSAAWAS